MKKLGIILVVAVMLTSLSCTKTEYLEPRIVGDSRRITVAEYTDKMKAGWVGQMAGVGWGAPTEFRYLERTIPENEVPKWKPEMVNQFNQDDIYVEMTFLRTLEKHGMDVSIRQAGIDFANSGYQLWHANKYGRDNLRRGIAPPDSGHPAFSKHSDDIDYQIEADYSGLIAPGMPNTVIQLGEKFGRLMNYGDGLYAGQFVGGMYAEAFFEKDINRIITAGLECIPKKSQYYECITDVVRWHRQYPDNWKKSWDMIEAKYHDNPDYRRWTCDPAKFNIDAKINGAYIVMGLLYGRGDPDKTMIISMSCGQDSDCNPSNAAGILFTTMGYSNLPERFKSALDPKGKFSHTPYTFPKLIKVCNKLAKQAVKRSGGYIGTDAYGRPELIIPVKKIIPSKLEKTWDPGPIENSKFTPAEMTEINMYPDMTMQEAMDKFSAGWKITNCGDSLGPGLYEKLRGRKNVLMTHPALDKTDCVISKDVTIPPGKKTTLKLTLSHHTKGDWQLIVKADGKELTKKIISPKTVKQDGWQDIKVDLSKFAGSKIKLELINHANDWNHESALWGSIDLITR